MNLNLRVIGGVFLLVLTLHFTLVMLKNTISLDRTSYFNFYLGNEHEPSGDLISTLKWDDPKLIQLIQNWFIEYPDPGAPYFFNTDEPDLEGQFKQAKIVDELLGHKTNGFFIECGAYDGETFSNTLLFELKRNWTGLLIEPNRNSYSALQSKNRKTFNINACLSGGQHPEVLNFINAGVLSGVTDAEVPENYETWRNHDFPQNYRTKTPCFSLYSILLAVGNPKIDFFSLDVEGFEWDIIKSIPWDKVDITVVDLEFTHLGDKNPVLEQFMFDNGYKIAKRIGNEDLVFIKDSYLNPYPFK